MTFQMSVTFQFLYDHVEHVFANLEISFQKCHEVLAIVRIHPHTVLQANKANRFERAADFVPKALSVFWDIENENAPFAVPSLRLCNLKLTDFETAYHSLSLRCETQEAVLASQKPLTNQPVTRPVDDFPLPTRGHKPKPIHRAKYIGRYQRNAKHSGNAYGAEY